MSVALVPELYVSDLAASLHFYNALGFCVRYARPEEGFAFLDRSGAELMIEEPRGRVWLTGPLEHPFGRGINLQISVDNITTVLGACPTGTPVILPCEDRTYRRAFDTITVRQFVVADPDGYLLRFSEVLAITPAPPPATP